ncbi:MAG: DNA polymerase III subunit [Gemmatimonadaceae bacterium]|nr:DNA polymerase III subunit [Gemmatimonadaceae bacterium]
MPLTPLIGHAALRARLDEQVRRGTLASSILFTGPPGIGKQRLALWLGQRLLCAEPSSPCGECAHCRYAINAQHPDLTWVFPRPNLGDSRAAPDDVAADLAEEAANRVAAGGIYSRPDGSAGIYMYVTRMLVARASLSPALARRKVFVIGEADRMISQAASDQAANAFLKLLEEPPADTTLILTSSEPGALLPTIRSRVIEMRVRPLSDGEVREFLALPGAAAIAGGAPLDELVARSRGAPGALADAKPLQEAEQRARAMLDAAVRDKDRIYRTAYAQGASGARGAFSDALDALTGLVHARARAAATAGDDTAAAAGARTIVFIEEAKRDAERNLAPQLVTFRLLEQIAQEYR